MIITFIFDLVRSLVNGILHLLNAAMGFISRILGLSKRAPKLVQCSHHPEPTLACPKCAEEQARARKYMWKIIIGLMLPFALQSLDTTM
ncbi:unnamed protein product [Parascedosporium putredinis]|uniref:Uncharacterized protein n=1 Tax=Parascedosporium putredinis TaxID=1442378 RepID=A0A9P1GY88_9PEZI|nr:unnamed protein product [Parascedosporium putredinis]CAI7990544.1 unnamed protein product [Parascedosporium putredinis]